MTISRETTWKYLRAGIKFTDPVRKALQRSDQAIAIMAYLSNAFPDKYPDGWIPLRTLMEITCGSAYGRRDTETLVEVLLNSGDVDLRCVKFGKIVRRYLRLKPGARREAILKGPQMRRLKALELQGLPLGGWRKRLLKRAMEDKSNTAPVVEVKSSGRAMYVQVSRTEEPEKPPKLLGREFDVQQEGELVRILMSQPCKHTAAGRVIQCPHCGIDMILSRDKLVTECLCTLPQIKSALGIPHSTQDELKGRVRIQHEL